MMNANEWKDKICYTPKNGYDRMPEGEREAMEAYCTGYKGVSERG